MLVPALLLALLAPTASADPPINVVGHAWAPFISPMGEPFRAHSSIDDTLADWFRVADRNHDGVLTTNELELDAERFFATIDDNHDGQIDPDELSSYEYDIAPDVQVMSRTKRAPGQPAPAAVTKDSDDEHARGDGDRHERLRRRDEAFASLGIGGTLQGAARYGLLNMPEPVAAADADFNRAISLDEFRAAAIARFQLLDAAHQGTLTLAQLEAMPHAPNGSRKHHRLDADAPDTRLGNSLPSGP